jgi:hypothetical protein
MERKLYKDYIFLVYLASDEDKRERCYKCASPVFYYIEGDNKHLMVCKSCGDSIMANQRRYWFDD